MSDPHYVVIVGAGRLGRVLAGRLSSSGHPVVVIDHSEKALEKLPPEFTGFEVLADAGGLSGLGKAKFDQADMVFATTGSDNLNLMIAQAAKAHFEVDQAVARVADPKMEEFCERLGVTTINPSVLAADAFLDHLPDQEES